MSELRYPNESKGYRDARAALLKDEQELADKVKSVAEKRRKLPLGGQLKEDYVFQWAPHRPFLIQRTCESLLLWAHFPAAEDFASADVSRRSSN